MRLEIILNIKEFYLNETLKRQKTYRRLKSAVIYFLPNHITFDDMTMKIDESEHDLDRDVLILYTSIVCYHQEYVFDKLIEKLKNNNWEEI